MDRGRHRAFLSLFSGLLFCWVLGFAVLPCSLAQRIQPEPMPPMRTLPGPGDTPMTEMPGMQGPRGRLKAAIMEMGGGAQGRIAQMSPEERKKFEENLRLWRQMPPEERQALKQQANARNREEIAAAIRESGLQLNNDQREIFALRYLQERRRLERDIQEQANAERVRRLPQILDALRREFAPRQYTVTPRPSANAAAPALPAPDVSVVPSTR